MCVCTCGCYIAVRQCFEHRVCIRTVLTQLCVHVCACCRFGRDRRGGGGGRGRGGYGGGGGSFGAGSYERTGSFNREEGDFVQDRY